MPQLGLGFPQRAARLLKEGGVRTPERVPVQPRGPDLLPGRYERTMMAWVRTAASFIPFGYSIYKLQGDVTRGERCCV